MEVLSVMDAKKCTGLESLKLQPLAQCKVAQTENKQCISFSGNSYNSDDPNTNMNTFYEQIQNQNRIWLKNWSLPVSITSPYHHLTNATTWCMLWKPTRMYRQLLCTTMHQSLRQ
jgi:hypothetical protein